MALKQEHESYLELFGVARKEKVAKALLADIRFVPRTGERIFIPLNGVRDWDSYTVVAVEYFLGYDKSAGEASRSISGRVGGITLGLPPNFPPGKRVRRLFRPPGAVWFAPA